MTQQLFRGFWHTLISFHYYANYFDELISISADQNRRLIVKNWIIHVCLVLKILHLMVLSLVCTRIDPWLRILQAEYSFFGEKNGARNLLWVTIMMQAAHNYVAMILHCSYHVIKLDRDYLFGDVCPSQLRF